MNIASNGRLRIVLDSNVYVSAFTNPQSGLFRIWLAALEYRYTLLVSPAIVNELAGVLRGRFAWDDEQVVRPMKLLTKVAEIIIPKITIEEVPEDADDNRILECAVAGKADLIVSGDRHLTD
jgi:putative PIN family toxin of toxin-antitoxin system